jgi:hypothetical protein
MGDMEGGIIDEMDGKVRALRYFKVKWSKDHLDVIIFANPPATGEATFFGTKIEEIAKLSVYKYETGSLQFGGLNIKMRADTEDKGELIETRSEIFIDDMYPGSKAVHHSFQHHFIVEIQRYSKCLLIQDKHGNSVVIRVKSGQLDWCGQGNVTRFKRQL